MESKDGLFNLVLMIVVLAAAVLGPPVQQWLRRRGRASFTGEASSTGPTEPRPPSEKGVEDVFDLYGEDGSQEQGTHEREPELWADEVVPEEAVAPALLPLAPTMRMLQLRAEERTPEAAPITPAKVEVPSVINPASPRPHVPRRSLEERLFKSRRWTLGAKLVIAREVLERPQCRTYRKKSIVTSTMAAGGGGAAE